MASISSLCQHGVKASWAAPVKHAAYGPNPRSSGPAPIGFSSIGKRPSSLPTTAGAWQPRSRPSSAEASRSSSTAVEDGSKEGGLLGRVHDFLFSEDHEYDEDIAAPGDVGIKTFSEGSEEEEDEEQGYCHVLKLEPQEFNDVWDVAMQALRERRSVILSTCRMEPVVAQRAVDFLAGATQILYGHTESLGDGIFMFTPSNATLKVWGKPEEPEKGGPSLLEFLRSKILPKSRKQ